MEVTNKAGTFLAEIKSTSATTKAPSGSFEAILSVPTVDRDGEIVDARCFDPLPDHITIDLEHETTVEKTVGSGRPYYDGDVLRFSGTYASHPLAQMTRSLIDEGHIRSMSVRYWNPVYETDAKDGLPHLRSAELLNAAIVSVPSNREALITASKAWRDAVTNPTLPPFSTPKSVVGSYEDRTEQLRQAIRRAYPTAEWCWVRATFDDNVVFDVELPTATVTLQAGYTVGDDGVVLGEAAEVDLAEVVIAPQKSISINNPPGTPATISTETTPETETAAKAAASSPADVDVAMAHRHRLRAAAAELAL